MATKTFTVKGKAEFDSSEIEEGVSRSETAIQTLDGAIKLVGGSVEVLAGGLLATGALSEEQAERFQGMAVGALAFVDGTKNVIEGLDQLSKVQKVATAAQKAFGIATKIALGPIGLAIAAFGAITAAVVLLKDKFEAVNKVFTFFKNIATSVADAIGLGTSEMEKQRQAIAATIPDLEYNVELMKAQGASAEELAEAERKLLQARIDGADGAEAKKEAEQALELFEANLARQKREREEKAAEERRKLREKEAAEKKAQAEKEAAEEQARLDKEKADAEQAEADRLQSLADLRQAARDREADLAADTEAKKLELAKQRELAELESLGATEEQKLEIVKFYDKQIVAANEAANAEIVKQNEETKAKNDAIAEAEAQMKMDALTMSVDAIQDGLTALFGESKAVAKANVLVDAAQAAVGIFKSGSTLPPPFNAIFIAAQLAALAATSRSAIQQINSAEPGSGGTPNTGTTSVPSFGVAGMVDTTGGGTTTGTPETQTIAPVQAYVVTGDVRNGLEAEAKLRARRQFP